MSLKISGGVYKNRRLKTPKGKTTRPTSELVRAALFNIIQSQIEEANFLDLFAGTGAMGLEALSRGAKHATFIESDKAALKTLHENIALLDVKEKTTVIPGNVLVHLKKLTTKFDLIFMDPPYGLKNKGELICVTLLHQIDTHAILKAHGLVFVEEDQRAEEIPKTVLNCLEWINSRKYGSSTLHQFAAEIS